MKIGLVCPYNIFSGGGVQECVLALRDGLEKRGHQARIITPQPRSGKGKVPEGVILVGGAAKFRSFHTSAQVSASVDTDKLDAMLARENFDILHFHEPWVPVLARQILSRSNAINIGTFHATLPERTLTKTIEKVVTPYTKSILKYLDVLTAVSPPATLYVKSISKRRVHIVPNGIDLNKYKNGTASKRHKEKTIFYVGRLEKRKGLKYLLDAFYYLRSYDQNYQLLIAGDGPDRKKLKDYVHENQISGVRFLGFVNEDYKRSLFKQSDIFCSPAMYGESFGIVLLEAMATGCVAVAGNNPGYQSVMTGPGQISIVNPKDPVEFARRLNMLAKEKMLRDLWKKWATREVQKFDYDNIIGQYLSIYKAAYAKKHSK